MIFLKRDFIFVMKGVFSPDLSVLILPHMEEHAWSCGWGGEEEEHLGK